MEIVALVQALVAAGGIQSKLLFIPKYSTDNVVLLIGVGLGTKVSGLDSLGRTLD